MLGPRRSTFVEKANPDDPDGGGIGSGDGGGYDGADGDDGEGGYDDPGAYSAPDGTTGHSGDQSETDPFNPFNNPVDDGDYEASTGVVLSLALIGVDVVAEVGIESEGIKTVVSTITVGIDLAHAIYDAVSESGPVYVPPHPR